MFAVRNAHPEDMIAILHTLNAYPDLPKQEICDKASELGFTLIDRKDIKVLITARDLFLVHKSKNVLTEKGNLIVQILEKKESLFMEILHCLFYSSWDPDANSRKENCFSWTYRNLCRILWNMVTVSIDIGTRRHFASQLADKARSEFREYIEKKEGIQDVSISRRSISNILRWIKKLKPPCLSESDDGLTFTRRPFCPPELMIMVIDFLYREKGISYASNMLLTEENIDALCCACLLEPDAFDEVLNWTTRQFDFLKSSIAGGGWGRHLTLLRKPKLTDLI